ncbi:hypothetical protein [Glycomyces arizonensis]|uniref:hypothetical protein n=1 Tax=Glycomyces arizonensis TaxID=256035 RepID=UPI00040CCC6D|nr:hypothetical protein [Glycomyces arizonensis]
MSRTYDIDQIAEIGRDVLPSLSNDYWDLAQGARSAGSARDSMFQEASVTTNTGPGSGGAPVQPPGAAEVGAAWRALYERFEDGMKLSAKNLEHLGSAMKATAETMREDEANAEFDLDELQSELDVNY